MKFRKKPVVIEAIQFDGTINSMLEIEAVFPSLVSNNSNWKAHEVRFWKIWTLEGGLEVSKGDWIIKGIKGEFYPCKPDVFEMTYDCVDEEYESKVQKYCELINSDKWDTVEFQDIQNCLSIYPQSVYQHELIKGAIDLRVRQWKSNQH